MTVTQRESLRDALNRALDRDPRLVLLGEDIADPYGGALKVTQGLSTAYPGRVLNTPISEAGMTGLASGAALRGMHPVVEIMFADFLTLCADQIVNHASKFCSMFGGETTLPMVVRTATGGYRGYGPTHSQSAETLFLGFPGMTVLAPSSFHDAGALLEEAIGSRELILFMEHKLLYEHDVLPPTQSLYEGFRLRRQPAPLGEVVLLNPCEPDERPAITIVTQGGIATRAFAAARRIFLDAEISCEIVIPARIKPLPFEAITASARRSGRVLVVEESHLSWGWGAEVVARLQQACARSLAAPIVRIGARDEPIPCARALENQVLPQEEGIARALMELAP